MRLVTWQKPGNDMSEANNETTASMNTNETPAVTAKDRNNAWSFENLRSLALIFLAVFAIRWSIASPYHVPTASMEPTIKVGDRLLAWKLA
ncbi:S26 family signal peptidase, partial [bacterium]|nr:S26 family signal peptidase [bacterium]